MVLCQQSRIFYYFVLKWLATSYMFGQNSKTGCDRSDETVRELQNMNFYVVWNGGAWFVKEQEFFNEQVANDQDASEGKKWWESWKLVHGCDGIEHARDKARLKWGVKGERWKE